MYVRAAVMVSHTTVTKRVDSSHFVFEIQPQNEYIEQFRKRHGYRLDHFEKKYVKYIVIQ